MSKDIQEYEGCIQYPQEFHDVYQVLTSGAKKYGANSWLKGEHFNPRDNYASICRHAAELYTGKAKDDETGLHPALHIACRALMQYTLDKRGEK